MAKPFDVIIERDEQGYYVATVAGLPGCHTQDMRCLPAQGRL